MSEELKNEVGINGNANESQPIVKTLSNESIKNKSNNPFTSLSPANSSKYPYSTPNSQTPKGIMNISGTSGAIVNNTPSGMRKVPTVTFSDPKKVVVTPLQQHIQQHKEQQRELKEQKELQKSQRNNSATNDEISGDVKISSKVEDKDSPVKFSLASPNNSTTNFTSANTSSASSNNENDIKILKDIYKTDLQPQSLLRKDTISNNETSNVKFQTPQKVGLSKDTSIIAPSPKSYDPMNDRSLSNNDTASRNNSIDEQVMSKEDETTGRVSPIFKQKSPISNIPTNPSNLGTSQVLNSKDMNSDEGKINNDNEVKKPTELQSTYGKDSVKNIHPSLPLDDGRLHVLLGACGSLSVLKLKLLIKKLEDVYGGQKKVAIQVIVTDTAERLLFKQHQEKQMMKEQKELKQQKINKEVVVEDNTSPTNNNTSSPDKEITSPKIQVLQQLNHHLLDLQPHVKVWKDSDEWDVWQSRTDPVLHIELRRWADILVVAPMTANTLSKIALGLCDNLLTNVIRAWNPSSPILLAPSMVSQSYNSVITKKHLKFIKEEMPWITVFKPAEKIMGVHGDIGLGGMMDPHEIVNKIVKELGISDDEDDDDEDEEDESDDDEQSEIAQDKETGKSSGVNKSQNVDEKTISNDSNRVVLKKTEEDDDDDDSDDFDDDDDETAEQEEELKEIIAEQKKKDINTVPEIN